jgi:anti-sigma factor RsiW
MIAFDDSENELVKIDLLLDGELPAEERRALLLRLDATADGWKRCALAFLEAQAWREAFQQPACEVLPKPIAAIRPRAHKFPPWLARAAVVMAAFGLGWAARIPRGEAAKPSVASVPVPLISKDKAAPNPSRVPAGSLPPRSAPTGYVQGLLEREGYRIEHSRILVPGATKDGRRIAVPVDRVRVRFVGNRAV